MHPIVPRSHSHGGVSLLFASSDGKQCQRRAHRNAIEQEGYKTSPKVLVNSSADHNSSTSPEQRFSSLSSSSSSSCASLSPPFSFLSPSSAASSLPHPSRIVVLPRSQASPAVSSPPTPVSPFPRPRSQLVQPLPRPTRVSSRSALRWQTQSSSALGRAAALHATPSRLPRLPPLPATILALHSCLDTCTLRAVCRPATPSTALPSAHAQTGGHSSSMPAPACLPAILESTSSWPRRVSIDISDLLVVHRLMSSLTGIIEERILASWRNGSTMLDS